MHVYIKEWIFKSKAKIHKVPDYIYIYIAKNLCTKYEWLIKKTFNPNCKSKTKNPCLKCTINAVAELV